MRFANWNYACATALIVFFTITGCGSNNLNTQVVNPMAQEAFKNGVRVLKRQDFDLAISYFSEAIRFKPDLAEA